MWTDRDRIKQRREQEVQNCRERGPKLPGVAGTKVTFTKARDHHEKTFKTATFSQSWWRWIPSRANRDSVKTW